MTIRIDLPDLERLKELIERINELSYAYGSTKLEIELKEAEAIQYAVNLKDAAGKPLSMAFINSTYAVTGVDGNIISLRKQLIDQWNQLETAKKEYDYVKLLIDIWRTQSANERTV